MLVKDMTNFRAKWLWLILLGGLVLLPVLFKERVHAQGGTIPPTFVTVQKALQPSGDPGRFNLLVDTNVVATNAGDGGTGTYQFVTDVPGDHVIGEAAGTNTTLSDYNAAIDCENQGNPVDATPVETGQWRIHVEPSDDTHCTITNVRKTGSLTVKNMVLPATDPGKFTLQVDGSDVLINTGNGGSFTQNVNTGPHTVGANTNPDNYTTTINCQNSQGATVASSVNAGPLTVPVGEDGVTCTITNTKVPSVLQFSKNDNNATAIPGNNVAYQLIYANAGGIARHIVITETVPLYTKFAGSTSDWNCAIDAPAGTVCKHTVIDPLNKGKRDAVNFVVKVLDPLPAGVTQLSNSATIGDDDLANANTASDTTPVNAAPVLTLKKDDGGVQAEPGKVIVYNLNYGNTGNQDATGVVITETVPANTGFKADASSAGWSCPNGGNGGALCTLSIGPVAAKASNVAMFAVTVLNTASSANPITNVALIGHSGKKNAASSLVNTAVKPPARLSLLKDDGGVSVTPGNTVAYTLQFANQGGQTATGVVIAETVPQNTTFAGSTADWNCSIGAAAGTVCQHGVGTVANGASGSVRFVVKVDALLPAGVTQVSNIAHISDAQTTNVDTSNDSTAIDAAPDLRLLKDDGGITAKPGDALVYTLSYTNRGNQAATGVALHETVPTNASFSPGMSTPGWQCTGRTCTYPVGALAGGSAESSVKFAVLVNASLPVGVNQLANTATIDDDGTNGPDRNPADNSASTTTPLAVAFSLTATKIDSLAMDVDNNQVVNPGDTLEYLVTLHNSGNSALSNLSFQDPLDNHVHLADGAVQVSQGTVSSGNQTSDRTVQVALGTLPAGADAQIRFRATVNSTLPAGVSEIINQGTIKSTELPDALTDDPDVSGNQDATRTPLVTALALRAILKDYLFADLDNDNKVSDGDSLLYRLTVTNVGNIGANELFIDDVPDAHSALVVGSVRTDQGNIEIGNAASDTRIRIHLSTGLPSGASVTVSFQVKITKGAGITQLVNQAQITVPNGDTPATVLSDDPDTAQIADATVTPLGSSLSSLGDSLYLPLIRR